MIALLAALAGGCGGASAHASDPVEEPAPAHAADTPFAAAAALPASPQVAMDIDLRALRDTPVGDALRSAIQGDGASDRVLAALYSHCDRIRLGAYGGEFDIALILDGEFGDIVQRQLADDGTPMERLGIVAYWVDEMVIAQTSPRTVVVSDPALIDELLRTAAGVAPAPETTSPHRALAGRRFTDGTSAQSLPIRIVFNAPDRGGGSADAIQQTMRSAGAIGLYATIDGDELRVLGAAQLPDVPAASALEPGLRAQLEELTRSPILSTILVRRSDGPGRRPLARGRDAPPPHAGRGDRRALPGLMPTRQLT